MMGHTRKWCKCLDNLRSIPVSEQLFVKKIYLTLIEPLTHGVMDHRIDDSWFQPLLHDWCNQGCGMYYPVCGMVHIKEPLLLIGKNSPCGSSRFPLLLSEWSFTICP